MKRILLLALTAGLLGFGTARTAFANPYLAIPVVPDSTSTMLFGGVLLVCSTAMRKKFRKARA
jgi:hypothetical protein